MNAGSREHVAVVTGAARNLGRAIALELAATTRQPVLCAMPYREATHK
jgi:NAD(P)-dependent dehydrogenase (short-subunit alcohol dehydrogenase family)